MIDRKRCDRQLSDSNTRPVTVIGIQGSVRASEERMLLQFLLVSIVAIWLKGKVMASVVLKRTFNSSNQLNGRMSGWVLDRNLAVGYAKVRSTVVFE